MKLPFAGAIDCDLHPAVPDVAALMPYLDDFWREHLSERYIDHAPFVLASYAQNLPQSARADWRPQQGVPGADLDALRRDALDAFGTRFAIANVLHGAVALYNADMAAALCKAVSSLTKPHVICPGRDMPWSLENNLRVHRNRQS